MLLHGSGWMTGTALAASRPWRLWPRRRGVVQSVPECHCLCWCALKVGLPSGQSPKLVAAGKDVSLRRASFKVAGGLGAEAHTAIVADTTMDGDSEQVDTTAPDRDLEVWTEDLSTDQQGGSNSGDSVRSPISTDAKRSRGEDGDMKLVDLGSVGKDEKILEHLEGMPDLIHLEDIDLDVLDEMLDEEYVDIGELDIPSRRGESGKRRGRRKGVALPHVHRAKIRLAMRGRNKYRRSLEHRTKIAQSMRKMWKKRREGAKPARQTTVTCSLCGAVGHNKRTCPRALVDAASATHRCSFCQQQGHNIRTCPLLKALKAKKDKQEALPMASKTIPALREEEQWKRELQPLELMEHPRVLQPVEVQLSQEPSKTHSVPLQAQSICQEAAQACLRAWRAGVRRQRLDLQVSMLDVADLRGSLGWPGSIQQQFRAVTPLVESILLELKRQQGLEGRLEAQVLDEGDAVGCWESKKVAAVLFPVSDTVDQIRGLDRGYGGNRLLLMINPQWQPGQVVSDFGFGVQRKLREDFVDSFEKVFFQKEINIFNDRVLLLRCYPGDWQVHLVQRSGQIELISTQPCEPQYEELLDLLRRLDGSMTQMSWIERLQMKLLREDVPKGAPQSRTCAQAKQVTAPPADTEDPAVDIVTGHLVRDLKMDPMR
ncbi:unnamed protein product [Ostreobium quekettii]|uniref:CCHC-type domain-containing protein n=1 Tax=Ostreobium quekettii TaxID=121088 RepID=A0A8S1J0B0_9CHLO|nr:unnamed protein product [Ostreobium quekettii]|eukprot:evm.model.scf_492.3 EVM.evm.TU.scf_492.3   scf_492:48258-52409(-)